MSKHRGILGEKSWWGIFVDFLEKGGNPKAGREEQLFKGVLVSKVGFESAIYKGQGVPKQIHGVPNSVDRGI